MPGFDSRRQRQVAAHQQAVASAIARGPRLGERGSIEPRPGLEQWLQRCRPGVVEVGRARVGRRLDLRDPGKAGLPSTDRPTRLTKYAATIEGFKKIGEEVLGRLQPDR
jgi:hypothetical protein